MFDRKGQITIEGDKADEDSLMALVLEAGADDLRNEDGTWVVLSAPENHVPVLEAIQKAGIPTESASVAMVPKNLMRLAGAQARGMMRLSEVLEEHDDVQDVYSNFDVDENDTEAFA